MAVHHFDQPVGNRQAKASAAILAPDGAICLCERLEDLVHRLLSHANTIVTDTQGHFQLALVVFDPFQGNGYLAGMPHLGAELDRIAGQVQQDLA